MTLQFKDDGGTDRAISEIRFKDDGGTDRVISTVLFDSNIVYITGAAGAITVAIAPSGTGASAGKSGHATTGAVVATPSGGTPLYIYAWTIEDALDGTPGITSPSAASTTFSISGLASGDFCTATARCTVVDANSFTNSGTCALTFYGG